MAGFSVCWRPNWFASPTRDFETHTYTHKDTHTTITNWPIKNCSVHSSKLLPLLTKKKSRSLFGVYTSVWGSYFPNLLFYRHLVSPASVSSVILFPFRAFYWIKINVHLEFHLKTLSFYHIFHDSVSPLLLLEKESCLFSILPTFLSSSLFGQEYKRKECQGIKQKNWSPNLASYLVGALPPMPPPPHPPPPIFLS